MPFLDSQTIRPLYDVHDGGAPVGYRCVVWCDGKRRQVYNEEGKHIGTTQEMVCCRRVTRTLAGMRSHQRIVHGIRLQQEFQFDSVRPTIESV